MRRTALPQVSWVVLAALVGGLLAAVSLQAAPISQIGTDQRVLVICVEYSDVATTRRATAQDWVNNLNAETAPFYNQATFGLTTLVFETPAGLADGGWLSLGYPQADYQFHKTVQDAVNLMDPHVDYNNYHRVLVITNRTAFGGQGSAARWLRVDEGVEGTFEEGGSSVGKRQMSAAVVNEWQAGGYGYPYDSAGAVMAHELGHQLNLPTHYGDVRWFPGLATDDITPWDLMGLSPHRTHFLGWAKLHREWIPMGPRVVTIGPPVGANLDQTVTLRPLSVATAGAQLIRIPFTSTGAGRYHGYVVENRRRLNGDEHIPQQGVLISLVDDHPDTVRKCIVQHDPGDPGDMNRAALEVGDVFTDAMRNLTITVVSQSGENYDVRVRYNLPPSARPDPQIIPWGAPPYETVDIWIDSEKNGWDTYRYTDAAGQPIGNGDNAWVDHDNRVYVRIRNIGPGVATNVRVQVYQNDPPGMGDSGANWKHIGTIMIPNLGAGATATEWVKWKPTVGAHTCLKAVIQDIDGELSTANNRAQENVTHFDSASSSPFPSIKLRSRVNNPFKDEKTPVEFHVRDLPPGWSARIEPPSMVLPPGGFEWVEFEVYPEGSPRGKRFPHLEGQRKDYNQIGRIAKPKIEALVPYADTFIILGGVDVWTHLVRASRLTCRIVSPGGSATAPAEGLWSALPGPLAGLLPRWGGRITPAVAAGEPSEADLAQLQPRLELPRRLPGPLLRKVPVYKPGTQMVLGGNLTPGVGAAVIAVEFVGKDSREVRFANTTATGEWRVAYVAEREGDWTAQAFFAGNSTLAPAESPKVAFKIAR